MLAERHPLWHPQGRTTTVVGRGEKGCAVGASTDTPSSWQVHDVLTELRGIARTLERIRSQLELAGFLTLMVLLTGGVLALIATAVSAGR
jgi:hypothetical protein